VACIPQRKYNRQRTDPLREAELREVIPFSVNGVCGLPLADALKKQHAGLDGRDDKMFVDFMSSISIRLEVRSSASTGSNNGLEYVCSGYRMRNGQGRSVITPRFTVWALMSSIDSNVDMEKEAG